MQQSSRDNAPPLTSPPVAPGISPGSGERRLIDAVFGQAAERPEAFSAADLPPRDAFPGYEVLHEIHRGGQGVVYLALQKNTKRRVAIKILHEGPFSGSTGRARFEREIHILGQLNHPNIVHIHDSGTTASGSYFYVMDYISGRPLDDLIGCDGHPAGTAIPPPPAPNTRTGSRTGRKSSTGSKAETSAWTTNDLLRLFLKICDAINAAHLRGVIHRDLKPSNIRIDQRGEPVVVDFGLAKVAIPSGDPAADPTGSPASPVMTMTGQFIGSLPWASPEQADGSPDGIDVRTDVYSLGVILYQLLTGRFPYGVIGNMRDVLDNILRAEPARPSSVGGRGRVNGEVETIVLKCLAKDKSRRYQSAGELARDIERYLAGEPIEAKRDSALYLITKTLKRHRVTAGVGIAFMLIITGSAAGMTALYALERDARHDEQMQRIAAVTAKNTAEEQRSRAERNFAAGRTLARSFIYEFSKDIQNLRGATPARERLAREASAYLASLDSEIGDDPTLLRELADSFDQLGRIQGGLYLPRVGTVEEAAKSFDRARAIREQVLKALPEESRSHADLAKSFQQAGWIAERGELYAKAFELYQSGIEALLTAERKAAGQPEALKSATLERYRLIVAQGDAFARQAEQAEAREKVEDFLASARDRYDRAQSEYWAPRLVANDKDEEARRTLSTLASKKASIGTSRGRAALEQAERLLKAAPAGSPVPARVIELYQEAAPRFDEAINRARPALDRFRELAADAPANASLERDLSIACNNLGLALSSKADIPRALGERLGLATIPPELIPMLGAADADAVERALRTEALAVYTLGLGIASRLAENDPKNIEALRDHAVMLNKVGNEQRWLARITPESRSPQLKQALASYTLSLSIRSGLYKTDPTARHLRDLGLAEFKLGQIHLALADHDGATRAASLASARAALNAAAGRFDELRTKHQALAETAAPIVEVRDALAEVTRREGRNP